MVKLSTRIRQIKNLEGFDIEVKKNNRTFRNLDRHNIIGEYTFKKALTGSKTVTEWRRKRFESHYTGYSYEVLDGNGAVQNGNTLLKNVRNSYKK